jgi:hypothetical protein
MKCAHRGRSIRVIAAVMRLMMLNLGWKVLITFQGQSVGRLGISRRILASYDRFSVLPDNRVLSQAFFLFQGFPNGLLESFQRDLPFF